MGCAEADWIHLDFRGSLVLLYVFAAGLAASDLTMAWLVRHQGRPFGWRFVVAGLAFAFITSLTAHGIVRARAARARLPRRRYIGAPTRTPPG